VTDASGDAPSPGVGRAAAVITFWNLISRLTGFARVVATASALGIATLGDTYQRTNQVSNVLFELLAGGMLFSVLVPSFVDVLHRGDRTEARRLAGALLSRGVLALAVVAAVGLLAARPLMSALSSEAHDASREAQVRLGVFWLWFVMPQLVFYAAGSVVSALLQAERRFVATSLAPACNNLIVTATMVAFAVTHDPDRGLALTTGEKVLLGGGTLAGSVAMTIVPFAAARRAGLGVRPRWNAATGSLRPLAKRGLWGAGHVGLNQVLLLATVVLAGRVDGGVIANQTAFTFFLLPHALLAHPIFTALYPRLARDATAGDLRSFCRDLSTGLRTMVVLLLPASAVIAVAAAPALSLVRLGQLDERGARLVAIVLAGYLVGLAGYSTFFLLTRASYALEDARRPTVVNLWVTVASVAAMVGALAVFEGGALLVAFAVIQGLIGTVGSVFLLDRLRAQLEHPVAIYRSAGRALLAAVAAVAVGGAVAAVLGWDTRLRAVLAGGGSALAGTAAAIAVLVITRSPEIDLIRPRLARLRLRGLAR
jgi:putative peptidoglycan lipid II flippase